MSYTLAMPRTAPKEERIAARITREGKALLVALANRYGVSESAVIEMAVREYAESRKITVQDAPTDKADGTIAGNG